MNKLIEVFWSLGGPTEIPNQGKGFHEWLYILSSIAIWLAFFALAGAQIYLINKRKDLNLKILTWLFIGLISFFGLSFLFDALLFWFPLSGLVSYVKFGTALVAWAALIGFIKMLPKLLQMKSQNQLKDIIQEQVSELNAANMKLMESERQFRILINNHPDSISQLNRKYEYVFVNKSILDMTKAPESFFVGRTIYDLGFPKSFVEEQEKHLKMAFEQGMASEFEALSELPQIGPQRFKIIIIPVWDKEGKSVETVLNIAKNITEQRQFEDDLNETIHELQELSGNLADKNRQLQDFAHIVSHNLRSPMSNLVALMSLYENEKSSEQKDFLVKKVGEVTRSFSKTIDELTEVVRIRQAISLEFQSQRFEDIVAHIRTMLDNQISTAKADISYDFTQCEDIRYPKIYLESILLNLITNAIKYRSKERALKIELSSRQVDGSVLLICKDNGLGIDLKRYGDKIFGMNKTFHSNPDSRGMGLFITRNQLESLGGSITVESEPEKGAVFTVLFN